MLKASWLYLPAHYQGRLHAARFTEVETVCLFIGYPRSGHSLIGSLLDAHPQITMAHELEALRYIYLRFSKNAIFYLMQENSAAFTRSGRNWQGYDYAVPAQWQGLEKTPKIIGDKHGESATIWLARMPYLLSRLRQTFSGKLKFLHIIRNPYDNISTIARKIHSIGLPEIRKGDNPLTDAIDYYFWLCKAVADVKPHLDMLDIRHEDFIQQPACWLKKICDYLNVSAGEGYLRDCAAIVFKEATRSRQTVEWTPALITEVQERMREFPFLQGYTFVD